jgi:hypothetical protein
LVRRRIPERRGPVHRWTRLIVAAPALAALLLGGLPARGEDSEAVKEERERAEKYRERMDERNAEADADEDRSAKDNLKDGVDQAGDAARLGGAKAREKWHQGVDAAKKGTNRAAKKVEEKTD